MSKYRSLFVEESREHLAELSRLLVELESKPEISTTIDDVFRRVHSIKGMAASMGFEAISSLAHAVEDIAAKRRGATEPIEPQVVDLLLQAVDALTQQVESVAEEAPIPSRDELIATLRGTVRGAESNDSAPREPARSAPSGGSSPPGDTGRVRRIRVTVNKDCPTPGVRLFMAHRYLQGIGQVVESMPSLETIKSGKLDGLSAIFSIVSPKDDAAIVTGLLELSEVADAVLESIPSAVPASAVPTTSADGVKGTTSVRVRTDILDTMIDNVGELFILRERLESLLSDAMEPELRATLDALSTAVREVHGQVMTVRMMPVRTLTDRYPRLVRDLARSLGKEIELGVEGSEIELDRAILDNLDEPLVHTLRNAVDHGIEKPDVRAGAGKNVTGRIRISASRDRDMVVLVVEDDGAGLAPAALRQRALESNLINSLQAENLSDHEALMLVCVPGLSTKAAVSDVSGRGVGMDAVRARVEGLGGTLEIESAVGQYTRFLFRLPLTVAIINVLLVEAAGRVFAVPIAKVVAVLGLEQEVLREAGGATYLSFREGLAPVFELRTLMGVAGPEGVCEHAVIIEDGRDWTAVAVERVVGYHEVVVKPLGDPLDRLECFAGATILGDGRPILILDLPKAIRAGRAA